MQNQITSFRDALDSHPVSRYQWQILALLALLLISDGYDAQLLGYVVPSIAQEWGLEKSAFGPVFSANLIGLTVGSLLVTPLADRVGIRRVLMSCVLLYACLTFVTVYIDSLQGLAILRFFCGLGWAALCPAQWH